MLEVGTQISVPYGAIRHHGIVVAPNLVAHASKAKQGVSIDSIREFAGGCRILSHGRLGALAPQQILRRALQSVGWPYDLFRSNCDHYVRHVAGLPPKSPQLLGWLLLSAALITSLALILRKH